MIESKLSVGSERTRVALATISVVAISAVLLSTSGFATWSVVVVALLVCISTADAMRRKRSPNVRTRTLIVAPLLRITHHTNGEDSPR